jgi:20S proteasome subunit beta 3
LRVRTTKTQSQDHNSNRSRTYETNTSNSFDSIGCIDLAKDFIVAGTASDQLFGTCEGLWEPDLEPEDLFETISQALLNAVDRDALSGWGAHVYIIEKDKVTKRLLKGRQD